MREGATPLGDVPRAGAVEAVLPAQRVLFARLKLPRVNAATIRELLPFAVEDRLLADPAQIHAVAGATRANGETVVAVVDRAWMRAMLQALSSHGFQARSAWCESELAERVPGTWHVVWGSARGLVIDDEGVAATFDPGEGLPLALRIALDEAAARGTRPSAIHVHTENHAALPDLARWSAEAGVSCRPAADWEQRMAATPAAPLNLLQGDMAPRSPLAWRVSRRVALLAGVIVALQLAFTAIDTWRLSRERDALQARHESLFREAFPEARVVVDPGLQMSRNLAELRRTRGVPGGDDFLMQLTRVARAANAPARHVEYANGKLVTR